MLACCNPTSSTRNTHVKKCFDAQSWKIFFSDKYIVLAMLTLESKVNFFLFNLHNFLVICFVLTFLTHCSYMLQQLETRMTKKNLKCELSFKKLQKYIFWAKKVRELRKSKGSNCHDLPLQWMAAPSSHTRWWTKKRDVGTRFHGAASLMVVNCLD